MFRYAQKELESYTERFSGKVEQPIEEVFACRDEIARWTEELSKHLARVENYQSAEKERTVEKEAETPWTVVAPKPKTKRAPVKRKK